MSANFTALDNCWVCHGQSLVRVHEDHIDLAQYSQQDPELSSYTGSKFWLVRCSGCDFIQPEALPTLPNYFDRMYDQQWPQEWLEREFVCGYKDFIFKQVLSKMAERLPVDNRHLLDIGCHVGRLIHLAQQEGWQAEGVELNPKTSTYAALKTKLPVHRMNARELIAEGKSYDAITMMDVLEHIPEPLDMLASLRELLKPGGWLAVKVPCGPNQLLKENLRARWKRNKEFSIAENLVHINHFSPSSLGLALERTGFAQITLTVGAPELSPSDVSASARSVASDIVRLGVYYLGRFIPRGVNTPLALNLQAYAQKA